MLVVITIIGILAALIIPATVVALRHGRPRAIYAEINSLERACKAYKEKFGEYPPDFSRGSDRVRSPPQAPEAAKTSAFSISPRRSRDISRATRFSPYQAGMTSGSFWRTIRVPPGRTTQITCTLPAGHQPSRAVAGQRD